MANRYTWFGAAMIFAGIAFRTMRWVWRTSREEERLRREERREMSRQFTVRREDLLVPGPGVESPPCLSCGKPLSLRRVGGESEPFRCRHCGWVVRVEIDSG